MRAVVDSTKYQRYRVKKTTRSLETAALGDILHRGVAQQRKGVLF